jgi:protein gp37
MGFNSKIEWTTHTFNPWWGCTKVSDGCKFCYAELLSTRYGHDVWGVGKQRRLLSENHWREPLKWNTWAERDGNRSRVFCASMADVFEEGAPAGELDRLWHLIRQTPMLDWQILTKRPERIRENLPSDWANGYTNVWLGTSVEDHRVIDRIEHLINVPAMVHFLSVEPLIGPLPNLPLRDIEWVIVGGESGPGARALEEEWVLEIRDQCVSSHVAFFFKQWGGVRKQQNGRALQGHFYNEMPELNLHSKLNERNNVKQLAGRQRQRRAA